MIDLKFEKPEKSDILQLKKLWKAAFNEDKKAVDLIFDRYFDLFNPYCARKGELIVAVLYLTDCSLNGQRTHYLCGAATLPAFRKQGIMSALIEYALRDAHKNGDKFSLLYPADEHLYSYYEKLGYSFKCTAKRITLSRSQLENFDYSINFDSEYRDFQQIQKNCFGSDFVLYDSRFLDFAVEYYCVYGVKIVKDNNGLAFVDENKSTADVFYFVYNNFEGFKRFLLDTSSAQFFNFTVKSDNPLFSGAATEKYGMIKLLADSEVNDDIYMGITLA